MKFKNTLILGAVFAVLLLFVLFIEKKPGEKEPGAEEKLVSLAPADIVSAVVKGGEETLSFRRDDQGEWMVAEPVEAAADTAEVEGLISALAELRIERVVEEAGDPKAYEIPQREAELRIKDKAEPVRIFIGPENKIDGTFYAQKEGDPRVVLLPSSLKYRLDKKAFDFRKKDMFRFEPKDVSGISLEAGKIRWEAVKKDGEWLFSSPFKALAKEDLITGLLDSLAGLRAKEFAVEAKTEKELGDLGLAKPEYTVTLDLPGAGKTIVFTLHKGADKTYATTSESTKVIVPESDILPDLERAPADLREARVAVFSSWQADCLTLNRAGSALSVRRADDGKWYFDDANKEEADGTKVAAFLQKLESLEAAEFIEAPKDLAAFGLDKPDAGLTILFKEGYGEDAKEKTVELLFGRVDTEKKQAVIKNARYEFLYRADASFLDEWPKEKKDWMVAVQAAEEKK